LLERWRRHAATLWPAAAMRGVLATLLVAAASASASAAADGRPDDYAAALDAARASYAAFLLRRGERWRRSYADAIGGRGGDDTSLRLRTWLQRHRLPADYLAAPPSAPYAADPSLLYATQRRRVYAETDATPPRVPEGVELALLRLSESDRESRAVRTMHPRTAEYRRLIQRPWNVGGMAPSPYALGVGEDGAAAFAGASGPLHPAAWTDARLDAVADAAVGARAAAGGQGSAADMRPPGADDALLDARVAELGALAQRAGGAAPRGGSWRASEAGRDARVRASAYGGKRPSSGGGA